MGFLPFDQHNECPISSFLHPFRQYCKDSKVQGFSIKCPIILVRDGVFFHSINIMNAQFPHFSIPPRQYYKDTEVQGLARHRNDSEVQGLARDVIKS
ncbi:hypothetical protein L2E82_46379 [Cichorium intybus]|uniref:Uncharacterized protein n=1 Tax=Cichorium intybus TaxID=13427 RepID=A0ACB8YTC8_CICIN|nr:hypothetical protein L2E82_46379 [Cichorium intybus]